MKEEQEKKMKEEEERKKKELDGLASTIVGSSNPTTPMGSSIPGDHFPLFEMGLEVFSPSKLESVAMLDSFVFGKTKRRW